MFLLQKKNIKFNFHINSWFSLAFKLHITQFFQGHNLLTPCENVITFQKDQKDFMRKKVFFSFAYFYIEAQ